MGEILGGERLVRMLAAEGVEVVFGIIDGSYFGLYSRLREHGIRLVTPRHETSAVHMAGAYTRATGRLGVCMASNGPGVANALAGVAVEQGEGNRVLLLTSWRRSAIVGPDRGGTYQYFDQVAAIRPMAKWSEAAMSFERIPEALRRCLRHAWQGRPGVVHLSVPEDILNGSFPEPAQADTPPERSRRQGALAPAADGVRRAAEELARAELPMIHAGSGVVHARAFAELREVAELLRAPVTTSWGGRDVIDERSPHAIPMSCVELTDLVRNEADCVLALGTRFGETDWWGKPPRWRAASAQKLVQVDLDENALGQNKPVDLAILSDVRPFLQALIGELKERDLGPRAARREAKLSEYAERRAAAREALDQALATDCEPMHSARVAPICQEVFAEDALLVIDGGNTAIWANMYHQVRVPGTLLSTFKFGMLGAGPGQALGAKVAFPERQVYCITGDGAMGFHPQEIETAIRCELPVVFVVLCDRQWGMVKVNQEFTLDPKRTLLEGGLSPEENIHTDLGEIRFDLLAESMGAHGERVSRAAELRPALERSLASGRCAVVHVDVDRRAHKFAPNLATFKEMHQEPQAS